MAAGVKELLRCPLLPPEDGIGSASFGLYHSAGNVLVLKHKKQSGKRSKPRREQATHSGRAAQDFDLPTECKASGELQAVHDYLAAWEARDSWKQSYYTPEQVVEGWKKHLAS